MAQSKENKTRGPQRRGARFEENEFELVVQHLVSEGIAESADGALIMLEGMSEEFITNILEQMQMGAAIVEFLIQNGEAESLEEANYIISEMDDENIELLVQSVIEGYRSREFSHTELANPAPSVKYPAKSAPYGGARSREFQQKLPEPSGSRGPEFEHGSGQGPDKGSLGSRYNHMIKNPKNLSKNTGKYPRDKKGNLMY